ncbi:hypothetical protein GQ53DRAFT_359899 [Thozetella sp. PMI_491]|nr:hypothetical protein GQ53DRAFT_359899 [Thozetella sp. PMI_491]
MPRRSRGCGECRQRRIGCDGGLPSCRQCIITNRACSGPVQHALIIDQTQAIAARHKPGATAVSRRPKVMTPQPSHAVFTSMGFISEFMTFLTPATDGPAGRPWLYGLDDIPQSQRGPALDVSLKATATVFCGIFAKNDVVVMEARQVYGHALSKQSTAISKTSGVPTVATICTTVILSLFETIWSTSTAAYAAHLLAARRMMSMADLRVSQHQLIRDLGVYTQCQTLFTMIIAPDAYLAAAREYPCDGIARYRLNTMATASDRLFTELFRLGELLVSKDHAEPGVNLDQISQSLDEIWLDIHVETALLRGEVPYDLGGKSSFPDAITAITVALYASARMLWHLVQPAPLEERRAEIEHKGQAILNCATFLSTQHVNCASLRMCFPLSLVSLHSTSSEQCTAAHIFLGNWLRATPFTGVCAIINEQVGLAQSVSTDGIKLESG